MTRGLQRTFRFAAGMLPLLAATAARGQEEEGAFDRTPRNCLIVSQIDGTEAVDDQTIIFRMRGKQVYRNTLPRKCPGLLRENRIGYETRSSQLCNIDMITVIEDFGVGLRPGFTCRLGEFVPLSPDDVEDLEYRKKNGGAPEGVIETSSVDVEGKDDPVDAGIDADEPAPDESPATERTEATEATEEPQ
jgi:hypothetical protein